MHLASAARRVLQREEAPAFLRSDAWVHGFRSRRQGWLQRQLRYWETDSADGVLHPVKLLHTLLYI